MGRSGETQRGGEPIQVQLVELEDLLVFLQVNCAGVTYERFLAEVLEVGVLEAHVLKVVLDAALLLLLDVYPLDGDLLLLQSLDHAGLFARVQKQHSTAVALVPGCTAHTVDVCVDVLWAVGLNHPVDGGKVDASCDNISGEKACMLGGREPGGNL